MSLDPKSFQASVREFQEARFQAALRAVLARLTRTSDELLSYEEVERQLQLSARTDRGVQSIPIAAIVGSVGRAGDFTRTFLPRRSQDQQRWARVRTAFLESGGALPAIEVYKVGEAYFVLDGNHRVSVARRAGLEYIDARVIEIQSSVPLTPDVTPDDLICSAEYAQFLDATGLDHAKPEFDFSTASCGQYPKLVNLIGVHRVVTSRAQGGEVTFREAAGDWFEQVYAPLVREIRAHHLLRWFPDLTETDLFLWVTEHQQQLRDELGWAVRSDAAMADLTVRTGPRAGASETLPEMWRSARLSDRYLRHLFLDLLVPLSGAPGDWNALEQAVVVAQKEDAPVHALHVVRAGASEPGAAVGEFGARFRERLAAASVAGELVVETGNVVDKIRERAVLADLIIMSVAHPPGGRLSALTSRWRALLNRAPRPVLAVPREQCRLARALVLFDGTPNSRQALFIAAYMGENWRTALTVVTPPEGASGSDAVQKNARAYLDLHELDADYVSSPKSPRAYLDLMAERDLDLLVTGNDAGSRLEAVRGGSLVNALLRGSPYPLLIC